MDTYKSGGNRLPEERFARSAHDDVLKSTKYSMATAWTSFLL